MSLGKSSRFILSVPKSSIAAKQKTCKYRIIVKEKYSGIRRIRRTPGTTIGHAHWTHYLQQDIKYIPSSEGALIKRTYNITIARHDHHFEERVKPTQLSIFAHVCISHISLFDSKRLQLSPTLRRMQVVYPTAPMIVLGKRRLVDQGGKRSDFCKIYRCGLASEYSLDSKTSTIDQLITQSYQILLYFAVDAGERLEANNAIGIEICMKSYILRTLAGLISSPIQEERGRLSRD